MLSGRSKLKYMHLLKIYVKDTKTLKLKKGKLRIEL